ncbi:MAG: TetR/AcrR family transcriptional regulator [Streptosporangiaceae bacterium]
MTTTAVERLVKSAQELLWERGYVGTSPRALLERAGVGQGSMYHHFTGKADLAVAAIEKSAAELREASNASLAGQGSPLARLRHFLLARRQVLRGCRIGRLAYDPEVVSDQTLRAPVKDTFDWLLGRIAEVIEEAQQAGELPATLDVRATAATIVAVVQGGYVMARATGSSKPFTDAVNGLVSLLGGETHSR